MNASLFFHEKPARMLIVLNDKSKVWYASLLAKEVDCTYAHAIKILDTFSGDGLVVFDRQGRIKRVMITDKGAELARGLETVLMGIEKPITAQGKGG